MHATKVKQKSDIPKPFPDFLTIPCYPVVNPSRLVVDGFYINLVV